MPDLRELITDPGRVAELSAEDASVALAALTTLERAIATRLKSGRPELRAGPALAAPAAPAWIPDDLLTVEEVAAMLQMSPQWVYRRAKTWPFTRKLSPKVLRFSRSGMTRWMAAQRP